MQSRVQCEDHEGDFMKLVVLKGGDEAVPLAQCSRASPTSTRAPGAVALSGDGLHWVLINVSPSVATQLSTDARLLRHPGLPDAAVRAVVLTDAQVDAVKANLKRRVGSDVTVSTKVDPSLRGGLVVRIGSQMIDSSIKTRLNSLANAMKG